MYRIEHFGHFRHYRAGVPRLTPHFVCPDAASTIESVICL